ANASLAVDGNTNPDWSAASISATEAEDAPWWQVDLEDTYSIGAIKLYARNLGQNRLGNVDVMVLDEDQQVVWSTYLEKEPNLSQTLIVQGENGTEVNGRYVK